MRLVLPTLLTMLLCACQQEAFQLPSGLSAELHETLVETQSDGSQWLVVRALAPDLAGREISVEDSAADTDAICREWGLPAAAEADPAPEQIVVQIMSQVVERGATSRGVAQIFGGYRYDGTTCIWEDF